MTRSILTRLAALVLVLVVTLSACDEEVIAPPNQDPTIQVTAPNGGEAVAPGSVLDITWTVNDPDGTIAGVDLSYTADNVTATSIATGETGTTFSWTVPATALYGVRVLAVATDDEGATAQDESDAIFAVVAASARGYVTASTCQDCHAANYTEVFNSGHPYKINKVVGGVSPTIPNSPGVPNPPVGFAWNDITYMIGGYGWKARFMDSEGYIITDGWNGVNAQYNLERPDLGSGLPAAWTSYHLTDPVRKPYTCGTCHTTGWQSFADNGGVNQDGLVGIHGTWEETGITCEACHGPGVDHVVTQTMAAITVDPNAELCGTCHFRDVNHRIEASGGFIRHHEQFDELTNGGKDTFDCTTCHDPHVLTRYGNADAGGILVSCDDAACHAAEAANNQHIGTLDCESCHMGRASKSARAVHSFEGDIRTHIFTINPNPWPKDSMFFFDAVEGKTFAKNFVTLDVACYTCHTDPITLEGGGGSQQPLDSLSVKAMGIHN